MIFPSSTSAFSICAELCGEFGDKKKLLVKGLTDAFFEMLD